MSRGHVLILQLRVCGGFNMLVIGVANRQWSWWKTSSGLPCRSRPVRRIYLGMMIQTLTSLYHQKSQPMKPTFRRLIAFNERKKESFHYWESRLQNSSQPSWSLSSPIDAVYSTTDRMNISTSFPMPSIQRHEGISTATFYHAACALVSLKCPEKKMLSLAVW